MGINKGFFLKKVGKEYMIIPTTNSNVVMNKIFNINEVGADIFTCLEKGKSIDETVSSLLKEYDVNEDTLREDVLDFVEELRKRGIYND
ncbi:MAG: PqqD family protein [Acholeplasmatales bacterium]|nr:PqqD family protein [Acholeplasmatales bacterium]